MNLLGCYCTFGMLSCLLGCEFAWVLLYFWDVVLSSGLWVYLGVIVLLGCCLVFWVVSLLGVWCTYGFCILLVSCEFACYMGFMCCVIRLEYIVIGVWLTPFTELERGYGVPCSWLARSQRGFVSYHSRGTPLLSEWNPWGRSTNTIPHF